MALLQAECLVCLTRRNHLHDTLVANTTNYNTSIQESSNSLAKTYFTSTPNDSADWCIAYRKPPIPAKRSMNFIVLISELIFKYYHILISNCHKIGIIMHPLSFSQINRYYCIIHKIGYDNFLRPICFPNV